jgi:molybdate transport system permease protein
MSDAPASPASRRHSSSRDRAFVAVLAAIGGSYVLLIGLLLAADMLYTTPSHFAAALGNPYIRFSIRLTLLTCTISTIIALWVGVTLGYLLSRFRFPGRWLVDLLLDIPLALPPLVLGLSLLILFHLPLGGVTLEGWLNQHLGWHVTYAVPSVILAQLAISCAFAARTMRVAFDEISPRTELVAMTLGCSRSQAFWRIVLPQAQRALVTAFALSWARSLGEFGPILVFSGASRMKTEVLSTSVFLELSIGQVESAVAVSLLMVAIAVAVLLVVRFAGLRGTQAY